MAEEYNFIKYLATQSGYDGDPHALALTHQRFLETAAASGGDLQKAWEIIAQEFGIKSELPSPLDIAKARHFWEENGVVYSVRVQSLFNGEILESTIPVIEL